MQRGKRTTTLRMQQRSKVKTWKNRDKAQKEEETKPVVGCDTEKTIYWLVGIEWDSEGSKNSQLFKDWKEIWTWQKRNRVSKSCVFTFAIFICHFLLKQHQLPTQYKILNFIFLMLKVSSLHKQPSDHTAPYLSPFKICWQAILRQQHFTALK